MQLVVRGVRRPVRLEEPESSLTDRREAMVFRAHAPPHGVCDYIALGKSAAGRGPSCGGAGGESPRTKQAKDDGRASKVHHGRQSRGSDIGDLKKTLEALSVVEPRTSLKEDFPGASLRERVEELFEEEKKELRRLSTWTGTPSAKPSSEASQARSGRECPKSMWNNKRRSTSRSRGQQPQGKSFVVDERRQDKW